MGLFNVFRKKPKNRPMYLYSEQELEEYESYVQTCLGSYEQVFHEIASPDVHLDVLPIPPDERMPFYKLVTMGAGAYRMNLPEPMQGYDLEYAEYMIFVPADWNLNSSDEKDYWPMRTLKSIARLPINADTWLGYGHTVSANAEGSPYAENTPFSSILLVNAADRYGRPMKLNLSSGRTVRFYLLIPLYPEELQYKMEHDADELLNLLAEVPGFDVVNNDRRNAVADHH